MQYRTTPTQWVVGQTVKAIRQREAIKSLPRELVGTSFDPVFARDEPDPQALVVKGKKALAAHRQARSLRRAVFDVE